MNPFRWIGVILLVCSISAFSGMTAGSWARNQAAPRAEDKPAANAGAACENMVCPLYLMYPVYPGFCLYYAVHCKTWVPYGLIAICTTPTNGCTGTCEGCLPAGGTYTSDPRSKELYRFGDKLKEGIDKLEPPKKTPWEPGKKPANTDLLGSPILANLQVTATTSVPVNLYLVLTTPPTQNSKQFSPAIFATGVEVSSDGSVRRMTIPNNAIKKYKDSKLCLVEVGNVTYFVILGKSTKIEAEVIDAP